MKTKKIIPQADILMGSMRSMGYSFEAAVADVVDNSISAQAALIHILFPTYPDAALAIGILDDGHGMSPEFLCEAMRYGTQSCESIRDTNDLGRFGLGLKAASLSQCRILTVVTYDQDTEIISGASWNYNRILKERDWNLIILSETEINNLPYIDDLKKQKRGTLIIWQDFDFIEKTSNNNTFNYLNEKLNPLIDYLELIYHRLLDSSFGQGIKMYINNYQLKPKDPFLENHKSTTRKKEIDIAIQSSNDIEEHIKVTAFVLPFFNELSDEDHKKLGGIGNLRKNQGFYIYRNKRLIIWGNWFGMNHGHSEITKYARIRVDIPNTLDDIWSIDIIKQKAIIPPLIKNQLSEAVSNALDISSKKQAYRGRKNNTTEIDYIWNRVEGREKHFFYEVNKENRLYRYIVEQLGDDAIYLDTLVTELEKNLPTQQIYLDRSTGALQGNEAPNEERCNTVIQMGITLVDFNRKISKEPVENIINKLILSEPFNTIPDIKNRLNNYYKENDK